MKTQSQGMREPDQREWEKSRVRDERERDRREIERLEKINDELKLLGYKKTWTEK